MRDWNELIDEGRRLVEEETDIKWRLGDLALEVAAWGDGSADKSQRLDQFADEIGVSRSSLREYRQVAHAWPASTRADHSWSVHRAMMYHENRAELIKTRDKWTQNEALIAVGKNPVANQAATVIKPKPADVIPTVFHFTPPKAPTPELDVSVPTEKLSLERPLKFDPWGPFNQMYIDFSLLRSQYDSKTWDDMVAAQIQGRQRQIDEMVTFLLKMRRESHDASRKISTG